MLIYIRVLSFLLRSIQVFRVEVDTMRSSCTLMLYQIIQEDDDNFCHLEFPNNPVVVIIRVISFLSPVQLECVQPLLEISKFLLRFQFVRIHLQCICNTFTDAQQKYKTNIFRSAWQRFYNAHGKIPGRSRTSTWSFLQASFVGVEFCLIC